MLFNYDLAGVLNARLGPMLLPLTLVKVTATESEENPTLIEKATVNHTGRGFVGQCTERDLRENSLVLASDRKIIVLGASLSGVKPEKDDYITIEGETFHLVAIPKRDPAEATYTCFGRK